MPSQDTSLNFESRNQRLCSQFLAAASPEDFLKQSKDLLESTSRSFSYASLARSAGFASRSYVRALFVGSKLLTEGALIRLSSALKFPKNLERSLMLAVQTRQETDPHRRKSLQLKLDQNKHKMALQLRRKHISQQKDADTLFQISDWVFIYSSMGDMREGSSADAISLRSGQNISRCKLILNEMINQGVARYDSTTSRYHVVNPFLNFEAMGGSSACRDFHKSIHETVGRKIDPQFSDPNSLFYTSVFSIKKSNLQKAVSELRRILAEFSEDQEDSQGDEIAILQLAFTDNKPKDGG